MNLRDVSDQMTCTSPSCKRRRRIASRSTPFLVDRLIEVAQVVRLADYVAAYSPLQETGLTLDDAAAAVREVRTTS
jgi:hypothetical protein